MPAVESLFCVGRCLKLDIACDHADFATLIHVERDFAEVHVFQFLVQRDRISADGGNGSPLRLPGIEVRGRENNLVADLPAGGVQDLYRICCQPPAVVGQLGPGVFVVPRRFRFPPMSMIPRSTLVVCSTDSTYIFVFDVVREGNCCLARVGAFSVPISNSP